MIDKTLELIHYIVPPTQEMIDLLINFRFKVVNSLNEVVHCCKETWNLTHKHTACSQYKNCEVVMHICFTGFSKFPSSTACNFVEGQFTGRLYSPVIMKD